MQNDSWFSTKMIYVSSHSLNKTHFRSWPTSRDTVLDWSSTIICITLRASFQYAFSISLNHVKQIKYICICLFIFKSVLASFLVHRIKDTNSWPTSQNIRSILFVLYRNICLTAQHFPHLWCTVSQCLRLHNWLL